MVERDVGEDAQLRVYDVGGVQSSSHAGFPKDEVALCLAEVQESEDGCGFKEGGWSGVVEVCDGFLHLADEAEQGIGGDGAAVDLDSFAEVEEVGRCEQSCAVAGGAVDAFEHGADGAFSVGAGNMDEVEAVLRVAQAGGQAAGGFESEFGSGEL